MARLQIMTAIDMAPADGRRPGHAVWAGPRPWPSAAVLLLACLPCLAAPATAAAADTAVAQASPATQPVSDDAGTGSREELVGARDRAASAFRAAYEAGRYNEALQHADRVLALTQSMPWAAADLPAAFDNRAAVHFRLGDYVAAEQDFSDAVSLLADREAASSPRLIGPLQGLGHTYAAAGRYDQATVVLERALQISRQSDGLFNLDQLDLLEPLIASDLALGKGRDADRHHLYAYRVAAHHYGPRDARLIPALAKLARWYAQTRRFSAARELYAKVLAIAMPEGERLLGASIMALRGTAETYRIAYQDGAEDPNAVEAEYGPPSLESEAKYYLDDDGRRKLETAFKLIGAHEPPLPEARAVLLIELADWDLLKGKPDRAWPKYAEAWAALPDPGAGGAASAETDASRLNPMAYPRRLLYRRPPSAEAYRDRRPETVVEHVAVAEFTVTPAGQVRDATVVEGDATKFQRQMLCRALTSAIYRPRFVDGKPVSTPKLRYRETFLQLKRKG
jgi:tetratricopeptide (TPR) repeat protein